MVVWDISRICPGKCSQILATLTASFIAVPDGMQMGWSSPMVPRLLLKSSPLRIHQTEIVWVENIYMLGGLCGLGLTVYLLDKIGRKKTILVSSVQSIVAWILMAFAPVSWVLLLGRFIAGLSGDINYITTPVYISEISEKSIRGGLGSTVYILLHFGVFLVYCIGPYITFMNTNIVGAVIGIVQFITFFPMPESPYYLLMKEQTEDARKSLMILRASDNVEPELTAINNAVKEENINRTSIKDLFTVKSNRKALAISTILSAAQDFSGMTVLIMNLEMILDDASSLPMPTYVPIIFALLVAISCVTGAFLIDFLGRRKLLIISCFSSSFFLFIIAIYFTVKKIIADVEQFSWVLILVIMLYAVTQKNGVGLVPIVITAELFPTNVKAYGCTIADAAYIIGSALSILLYNGLASTIGTDWTFYIFGICTVLTGIFTIFVVPETKGKTLYEIQKILKGEGDCQSLLDTQNLKNYSSSSNLLDTTHIQNNLS